MIGKTLTFSNAAGNVSVFTSSQRAVPIVVKIEEFVAVGRVGVTIGARHGRARHTCYNPNSEKTMKGKTDFKTDKRRKHHHFEVTISYNDGEKFVRMYTDKMKAARFAARQKKSPVIKTARVRQVS
jgi:hypothetical protein